MWGVANGGAVDPEAPYVPRQFTVNDRIFPNTLNDPFGHVQIGVGTSCYITIANQGSMDHVLHFHGFHVEVLQASQHPERVGWTKDTMPFLQGEVTVVRLDAFPSGYVSRAQPQFDCRDQCGTLSRRHDHPPQYCPMNMLMHFPKCFAAFRWVMLLCGGLALAPSLAMGQALPPQLYSEMDAFIFWMMAPRSRFGGTDG